MKTKTNTKYFRVGLCSSSFLLEACLHLLSLPPQSSQHMSSPSRGLSEDTLLRAMAGWCPLSLCTCCSFLVFSELTMLAQCQEVGGW